MDGWIDVFVHGWMEKIKTPTGLSTLKEAFTSIQPNEKSLYLIFKQFIKQLIQISHNEGKLIFVPTKSRVFLHLITVGAVHPDPQRLGPKPKEMLYF